MSARSAFVVAGLATFIVSVTSACAPTADKAASKWSGIYGSTWTLAKNKVGDINPPDAGGSAYSVSIGENLIVAVIDGKRDQENTSDVLDALANSERVRNASECVPPKDTPELDR